MKTIHKVGICIIIGFAAVGVVVPFVLCFLGVPQDIMGIVSTVMGIIGTIASVVLSVVAMIYSNKSSQDAENSLNQVTKHYQTLCEAIKSQQVKAGIGKSGVDRIIEKYESIQKSEY